MIKMNKKKKIALSVTSAVLVAGTLVTTLTLGRYGQDYYSFEYIEKMKASHAETPMKIMEIAPSGTEGSIGYTIEGSEPFKDWYSVASMYNDQTDRVEYASGLFKNLKNRGLLSASKDAAPLYLVDEYEDKYPWAIKYSDDDKYEVMNLDATEAAYVKGKMTEYTGNEENGSEEKIKGGFDYSAEREYSIASLSYKSIFKFAELKSKLGVLKKADKGLMLSKENQNKSFKVFGLNTGEKGLAVFGSTQDNWKKAEKIGYDSLYDLTTVYKAENFYTMPVEDGKTYYLTFDALLMKNGANSSDNNMKGQVTVIPLDKDGKAVKYSTNYSNQTYLWSNYFTAANAKGDYKRLGYQFSIYDDKIKSIQVRFDISDTEAYLCVDDLNIYEYAADLSNVEKTEVTPKADKSENKFILSESSITCTPYEDYIISYHVENKGGAQSFVRVKGKDGIILKNVVNSAEKEINDVHSTSGTYQLKFNTLENDSIKVEYGTIGNGGKVVFLNTALCEDGDYISVGDATHRQIIDYFRTGNPESKLSTDNIFNYSQWYNSGSNSVFDSNKRGDVTGYSNGVILLDSKSNADLQTKYNNGNYIPSDLLYYMQVNPNRDYQIKFRPQNVENSELVAVKAVVYYYDDNRRYIGTNTEFTADKDSIADDFFTGTFTVPGSASYIQISFQTTEINQQSYIDNISINEFEKLDAFYYSVTFSPVADPFEKENGNYKLAPGTPLYTLDDSYHCIGTVIEHKEDGTYTYEGFDYPFDEDGNIKKGFEHFYFVYDKFNDRYIEAKIDDFKKNQQNIYVPGKASYEKIYKYAGTFGSATPEGEKPDDELEEEVENFYIDRDLQYYTAEINYTGFTEVTLDNKGSVMDLPLYIKDEFDRYAKSGMSVNDASDEQIKSGKYYCKVNPVSYEYDAFHPYYVEIQDDKFTTESKFPSEFVKISDSTAPEALVYIKNGDTYTLVEGKTCADVIDDDSKTYYEKKGDNIDLFFTTDIQSYTYVGRGYGDYSYGSDSETFITINTDTIFYKGRMINNNWFKRYVMDCDRDDYNDWIEWKIENYGVDPKTLPNEGKPKTEIELEKFDAQVITYTPDYLNSLAIDKEGDGYKADCDFMQAMNGFELVCFTGGIDLKTGKNAAFRSDIREDVVDALETKILRQTATDDEFIPVIVDVNLLSLANKYKNLRALATSICTRTFVDKDGNTTSTELLKNGGVSNYIYRFDGKDLPDSIKFIANKNFKTDIDEKNKQYENENNPYYEVWSNINYENSIRNVKGKYKRLNPAVTEASIIRHILNFRGKRLENSKPVIRILEIEPYTDKSSLVTSGKLKDNINNGYIDVRCWFDENIESYTNLKDDYQPADLLYSYVDEAGNTKTGETEFKITTMAPGELVGKIEDIAENYDLIYIGASLDGLGNEYYTDGETNIDELPESSAKTKKLKINASTDNIYRRDAGDVVPNYVNDSLDGLFYYSVGDDYSVDSSRRNSIAGGNYDDYIKIEAFGYNYWTIDGSDYTLRSNGNDLTDAKSRQLEELMSQGIPVILNNDLALQEFSSDLRLKISGTTFYQRKGRKTYLPGHKGEDNYSFECKQTGTHVLLQADLDGYVPKGAVVKFDWYYSDPNTTGYKNGTPVPSINEMYSSGFAEILGRIGNVFGANWGAKETATNVISIDTNGDEIPDRYFIDIIPEDGQRYGNNAPPADVDYYAKAVFDFSQCKDSQGKYLRYNGLYGGSKNEVEVYSNKLFVQKEKRTYDINYFSSDENTTYRLKFLTYLNTKGISVLSTRYIGVCVTPIPLDANDNVLYRAVWAKDIFHSFRETTFEWDATKFEKYDDPETVTEDRGSKTNYNNYHGVFHVTDGGTEYELAVFGCENHYLANLGYCLYFNDEGDQSRNSRVSVGGKGTFPSSYSGDNHRTFTVNGYKLSLKDADDNELQNAGGYINASFGYNINGTDVNGNDVYGKTINVDEHADVRFDRVDTSSNLFNALTYGFTNFSNVFTQDQVERTNESTHKELLKAAINLSEPQIVVVDATDNSKAYPEALSRNNFKLKFKIINNTDLDTMTARYMAQFFIDENGDGQFTDGEEVKGCSISPFDGNGLQTSSAANGMHEYTLDVRFSVNDSGIKPWKLKVTKIGDTGAHNSISDYLYIPPKAGKAKVIKALQILPGDWDPEYVNLSELDSKYSDSKEKGERSDTSTGAMSNYYGGNLYKGSVFLSDVYLDDELININNAGGKSNKLSRTIYYCNNTEDRFTESSPILINFDCDENNKSGTNEEYKYSKANGKRVHHVEFTVGNDYILKIYFASMSDMNKSYSNSTANGLLDGIDMIIMGFGDGYSSMRLGKVKSAIDIPETMGLNENSALAIEGRIKSYGLPVVFCHDSTSANMNFANTLDYEVKNFLNDITNGVMNFWKESWDSIKEFFSKNFGDGSFQKKQSYNEYNAIVHSRRVSEGYYSNYILRDALGLDAFGITVTQRERGNYSYSDAALMQAHSYNNIYNDVIRNRGQQYIFASASEQVEPKNSSNAEEIKNDIHSECKDKNGQTGKFDSYGEWKRYYLSLSDEDKTKFENANRGSTAYNALMLDTSGYKVAWEPTRDLATANTRTTAHTNGYTTYNVKRYKEGNGASYTRYVTQVNSGQITTYPYDINTYDGDKLALLDASKTQAVKETHEQYFQVNLDENVNGEMATVWYCLASDNMSRKKAFTSAFRNDCENAYFIYTKGNVTYTGAGHQNSFTAFEAKLFMNTLIGSSQIAGTPSICFCDKNGFQIDSLQLVQSDYDAEVFDSSGYNNDFSEYHTKSAGGKSYIVDLKDTDYKELHFKINNASSFRGNVKKRKISFYYVVGNEQTELKNIKVYKGKSVAGGTLTELDSIEPGEIYSLRVPEAVLSSLVTANNDSLIIKNLSVKLLLKLELSDDELYFYTFAGKSGSFERNPNLDYYIKSGDSYAKATDSVAEGTDLFIRQETVIMSDFYGQEGDVISYLKEDGTIDDSNKNIDAAGQQIFYYREKDAETQNYITYYFIEIKDETADNESHKKTVYVKFDGNEPSSISGTSTSIDIGLLPLLELR